MKNLHFIETNNRRIFFFVSLANIISNDKIPLILQNFEFQQCFEKICGITNKALKLYFQQSKNFFYKNQNLFNSIISVD
jgi:hypothetical protein